MFNVPPTAKAIWTTGSRLSVSSKRLKDPGIELHFGIVILLVAVVAAATSFNINLTLSFTVHIVQGTHFDSGKPYRYTVSYAS